MPKRTMKRNKQIYGNGITDVIKSIYNKAVTAYDKIKSANAYLKNQRFAGRLVEAIPMVGNVPVLGTALNAAASYGYAPKRRTRRRL